MCVEIDGVDGSVDDNRIFPGLCSSLSVDGMVGVDFNKVRVG